MKLLSEGSKSGESKKAFRLLFDRHGGLVLGYCTRLLTDRSLAEDVAQDVWMKVLKNASTYESRNQLRPWLLTIARNTSLNILRTRKSWVEFDTEKADGSNLGEQTWSADADILGNLIAKGQTVSIRAKIDALPAAQRTALSLLTIENLTYEEIAIAMSLSVGAVKTHIHRGRQTLLEQFAPLRRDQP